LIIGGEVGRLPRSAIVAGQSLLTLVHFKNHLGAVGGFAVYERDAVESDVLDFEADDRGADATGFRVGGYAVSFKESQITLSYFLGNAAEPPGLFPHHHRRGHVSRPRLAAGIENIFL